MVMQSGKSPLAGKARGLTGAVAGTRGKPVEIGRSRLPAGIKNGVAKLSQCGIGTFEPDHKNPDFRGKLYWAASGVVVSPEEHEGVPVRGLQTWHQRVPLFDTPKAAKRKTVADHYKVMRDQLVSLGFNVDDIAVPANLTGQAAEDYVIAAIEAGCKALEKQAPYFRFRTWQGAKDEVVERGGKWFVVRRGGELGPYSSKELLLKANPYAESDPLVNEQWEGAIEGFSENGEAEVAVEDNTGGDAEAAAEAEGGEEVTGEEAVGEEVTEVDLDALATAADAKDVAAQQQIDAIADGLGLSEECGNAETYAAAVEIIKAAQAGAEGGGEEAPAEEAPAEEEPAADEPWQPATGDEYEWQPPDPKDKSGKKRLKAISVIVEKVYTKNATVTAKSNVTKKLLTVSSGPNKGKPLAIKWSELEQA